MNKKFAIIKLVCLVTCVCIIIFCSSCGYKGYAGDYIDLYTVAINSVLWNNGHSYGADRAIDSKLELIEEDTFGRKLFTYYESYYSGAKLSFSALLISQYASEEYVYYYEDYNYILLEQELYASAIKNFANEDIEYLKIQNDWDKEINLDKCIKKEISNTKQQIPIESQIIKEKAVEKFGLMEGKFNIFMDMLTYDSEGNFILYGSIIKSYEDEDIYFATLVMPNDNSQDIEFFVPLDIYNYHEEFIKFKQENGWVSIN